MSVKKVIIAAAVTALSILTGVLSGCSKIGDQSDPQIGSDVQVSSDVSQSSTYINDSFSGSDPATSSTVPVESSGDSEDNDQSAVSTSSSNVENTPSETEKKGYGIVLVGDSRIMQLGNYIYDLTMIDNRLVDEPTPDGKDYILGAGGEGYKWLDEHTSEIEAKLSEGTSLVVNMGVNGVPNFHTEIAAWCNKIAAKYKDKGVKVYFMSVNPVNDVKLEKNRYSIRNVDVVYFNSAIRTELVGVTYIDTYTEVLDDILGEGNGTYDGLHYYFNVYRKIRDYTWEFIENE